MCVLEEADAAGVALGEECWVWDPPCPARKELRKITLTAKASGERIGTILSDVFQAY
jgi:hypothetical protein